MKTKKSALAIAVSLLVMTMAGCSTVNDDPRMENDRQDSPLSYRVSSDEAANFALEFINTRNEYEDPSYERKIGEVIPYFRNGLTRSGESEATPYYVVNFENEGGFVLVSGDKRLLPVYAFSDEGSLALSDTLVNEGLRQYMAGLPVAETTRGPILDWNNPFIQSKRVLVYPMLSAVVSKWTQMEPYNSFLPVKNGICPPLGCTPVALGMVLSAHRSPTIINGYPLNWTSINNDAGSRYSARLLAELGSKECLEVNYAYDDKSSSICALMNVFNVLGDFGYDYKYLAEFDPAVVLTDLEDGLPVMIEASKREPDGSLSAHTWVVDGMMRVTWIMNPGMAVEKTKTSLYSHCVWGWSGSGNGYYIYNDGMGGAADFYEDGEKAHEVGPFEGSTFNVFYGIKKM